MWVPMLVLAARIYVVCKDRAKKFGRVLYSWSQVIYKSLTLNCQIHASQLFSLTLATTHGSGDGQCSRGQSFFCKNLTMTHDCQYQTYHLLPFALRDCIMTKK